MATPPAPLRISQNGLALSVQQGVGDFLRDFRTREYNLYLQDDWKVHPSLTLSLGLRYEIPQNAIVHSLQRPPRLHRL